MIVKNLESRISGEYAERFLIPSKVFEELIVITQKELR